MTRPLKDLFGDPTFDNRPVYHPKVKITSYDQEVFRNHLAKSIRPIVERYFSRMDPHDEAFMESCYIRRREYRESEKSVNQVIHDTLSPYFRDFNVKDLFEECEGGEFFETYTFRRKGINVAVMLLCFLVAKGLVNQLLQVDYFTIDRHLQFKHFSVPIVVDLLECPEDKALILQESNKQLIEKLDRDQLLFSERETLIELFNDRYSLAKKQSLAGLDPKI